MVVRTRFETNTSGLVESWASCAFAVRVGWYTVSVNEQVRYTHESASGMSVLKSVGLCTAFKRGENIGSVYRSYPAKILGELEIRDEKYRYNQNAELWQFSHHRALLTSAVTQGPGQRFAIEQKLRPLSDQPGFPS